MPSLMAMLGLNNSSFLKKLHESREEAKEAGREIASSLGEVVTEKLGEFISVAAIEEAIRGTIEWGEQVSVLSQRLGISTEAVQQWDYALKLNNSSIQSAATFFEKLATSRRKAMEGKDEQIQAFRELGITIDDLKNKRIEDIAKQIAEVFESGDPQKLIGALRDVGGKGAGEMVVAFRDGLAELLDEAPKVGDAVIDSLREAADASKSIWMEFRAGIAPLVADLTKFVQNYWHELNRAVRGLVGFATGGLEGAKELTKEYDEALKDAEEKAEARNKKRHQPFSAGGLDEGQSKEAAREEKRLADEKLRLEQKLYDLKQKNALEALPKEQQITELHRRRAELAKFIAQHGKEMSETGRLQAQIDLEGLAGEEDRARRGLKPEKEKKPRAPDVNQLQRIGAFTGIHDPKVDLMKQGNKSLQRIEKYMEDLSRSNNGGVSYG